MKSKDKIKYWLELSEYDLETAEAMLATKRFLYVGFMCHLTIEKILKAYYILKINENPPFTHKLTNLAQVSNIYSEFNNEFKDLLDILEPLNIEARYPTDKEEVFKSLNENVSNNILNKTKRLHQWIKRKL